MAKARALDKRRKSIRNIRKITRTMELIATARFKKAMDRAHAASAYTERITQLVADLVASGLEVSIRCWRPRETTERAVLLVLTANRGLCGGYNSGVQRAALIRYAGAEASRCRQVELEMSGKRGIAGLKFRGRSGRQDLHAFRGQAQLRRSRRPGQPLSGRIRRRPDRSARRGLHEVRKRQPAGRGGRNAAAAGLAGDREAEGGKARHEPAPPAGTVQYEFLPSAESILDEVVPTSFKVKLFKCFLDAAVSEQVARMVAMKAATENASDLIKQLSMAYNRARQSQITGEIMEIIGGVEALRVSAGREPASGRNGASQR